jgi:hypothetical protein
MDNIYSMKKISLSLLLILSITGCFAQRGLLFTNKSTQKEILVREGDLVKFSYNGYIGQREIKSGVVMSIQDSVISLIAPVSNGRINTGATETRFIYVKDITGFRKFRRSRPYLMGLSNISVTVGSILLFYAIDQKTDFTFTEKLGISLGTGLLSTMIVRAAFPERIKNKIGEEWEVKVLK